jgi:conjugative transfer signal peptidase TraF
MKIHARPLSIILVVFLLLTAVEVIRVNTDRRYWLNLSSSEPVGLYVVNPLHGNLTRGVIVLMRCPDGYEKYLYGRNWLPKGWPLFKTVSGTSGDRFCIMEDVLTVNGRVLGTVYASDDKGRPLPKLKGCRTIPENHFLPIGTRLSTSFDGRYFGAVPVSLVIGTAKPVLIFK